MQNYGRRPKYLVFDEDKKSLWEQSLPLLNSPVVKEVYVDELPYEIKTLAGELALSNISNLNPDEKHCYAVFLKDYQEYKKQGELLKENPFDGKYLLQVWKYNFKILMDGPDVDPLSLYLSFKDNKDERIQLAIEQIIKSRIW